MKNKRLETAGPEGQNRSGFYKNRPNSVQPYRGLGLAAAGGARFPPSSPASTGPCPGWGAPKVTATPRVSCGLRQPPLAQGTQSSGGGLPQPEPPRSYGRTERGCLRCPEHHEKPGSRCQPPALLARSPQKFPQSCAHPARCAPAPQTAPTAHGDPPFAPSQTPSRPDSPPQHLGSAPTWMYAIFRGAPLRRAAPPGTARHGTAPPRAGRGRPRRHRGAGGRRQGGESRHRGPPIPGSSGKCEGASCSEGGGAGGRPPGTARHGSALPAGATGPPQHGQTLTSRGPGVEIQGWEALLGPRGDAREKPRDVSVELAWPRWVTRLLRLCFPPRS